MVVIVETQYGHQPRGEVSSLTYSLQSFSSDSVKNNSFMNPTFVLLGCEKGLAKNICKKIVRVPTVTDVKCVEGMYDMVIRLDSPSFDEIKKAIIERIRTMDGVLTCITLQGAKSFDSIKRLWNK